MSGYHINRMTGIDTNTGLTEALAWETLEKSQDGTVVAGDIVWVKIPAHTIDNAAAVDKGGGLVGIPITSHVLVAGETILIDGTTNYDGLEDIVSQTTNEIVITATYSAETFGGTETVTARYIAQDGANNSVMQTTVAGTVSAPIVYEGYGSTKGDNGRVIVSAYNNGGTAFTNAVNSTLGSMFYIFKNFRFTQASGDGSSANGTTGDYCIYKNCRSDNNGGWGFIGDNGHMFLHCEVDSNTSGGIDVDYNSAVLFSKIHSNSGNAINTLNANMNAIGNILYNNGGNTNIRILSSVELSLIIGNTIDGDDAAGSVGILNDNAFSNLALWACLNNIIMDCASGIVDDIATGIQHPCADYNRLVSNTTDYTGLLAGDNDTDTETDPFTDSGARNYTLADGSGAINAATDADDIV